MVNLDEKIKELSDIERKVILSLSAKNTSFEDLSISSAIPIDSVRRAAAWLNEKGFAVVSEKESDKFVLTPDGEKALAKGMPENILLETLTRLGGKSNFAELEKESQLSKQEFMAALGINKRKAFVIISQGSIEATGVAQSQESFSEQNFLRDVVDGKTLEPHQVAELQKRGLVEKKKVVVRAIKISENGEKAKEIISTQNISRAFNVEAPVPPIFLGKRAPYIQFLNRFAQN